VPASIAVRANRRGGSPRFFSEEGSLRSLSLLLAAMMLLALLSAGAKDPHFTKEG
jgi:hypothetical protein